jgi:hypothetical protein
MTAAWSIGAAAVRENLARPHHRGDLSLEAFKAPDYKNRVVSTLCTFEIVEEVLVEQSLMYVDYVARSAQVAHTSRFDSTTCKRWCAWARRRRARC